MLEERLPLRQVDGLSEVRARLAGAAQGFSSRHDSPLDSLFTAPPTPPAGSFPWSRPAPENPDPPASVDPQHTRSHSGAAAPRAEEPHWWEGIPAVRQLLLEGLALGPATVFIGENGSGKSTLVEALAMAFGLAPEGGSTGSLHHSRASEAGLWQQLAFVRNAAAARGGYFLRAETMHGFYTYLENNPRLTSQLPDYDFHDMSHGESFVTLVEDRFTTRRGGLYVLDEPESALSFENQLRLLKHLQALMSTGRHQVVMATHSPILAALPGATLLEVDERGMREVDHDDASLVRNWRNFLNRPADFLD